MANKNIIRSLYVHYRKENYNRYMTLHSGKMNFINYTKHTQLYRKYAKDPRVTQGLERLKKLQNPKTQQSLIDTIGAVKDASGESALFNKIMNDAIAQITKKIPDVYKYAPDAAQAIKLGKDAVIQADKISKVIQLIKDVDISMGQLDAGLVNYMLQTNNINPNIKKIFGTGKFLDINKSDMTSFENLLKKQHVLENALKQLNAGNPILETDTVTIGQKTYTYGQLLYSIIYPVINIVGGIGEATSILKMQEALVQFEKEMKAEEIEISFDFEANPTGASQETNKADYSIIINEKGSSFKVGFSAKNQNIKQKSKQTETHFHNTTNLGSLVNKISETNKKYVFYNSIAHNKNDAYMQFLRKDIAAKNAFDIITGINAGENVLFIQYANDIVSVSDFFNELAKNPKDGLTLSLSHSRDVGSGSFKDFTGKYAYLNRRIKESVYEDKISPEEKNNLAYARSKEIVRVINGLSAEIVYKH